VNSIRYREVFPGKKGLLIADECHHYGASTFQYALRREFSRRLGLTATYERDDNGINQYLNPYFKGICYSYNYQQAITEDVISHFKIAFIGIELTADEMDEYELYNSVCRDCKRKLISSGISNELYGDFMKDVVDIAKGKTLKEDLTEIARNYLYNFSRRRMLLANITNKYKSISMMTECVKNADRTIIFSQTQESATRAVQILQNDGIIAEVVNSKMKKWERKKVLLDFEVGDTEAVAAPILLDEGVNVPSADLAIILASSRSKRQMIQRMGRVLRKKNDKRIARIVVFFGINTSEDPKYKEDFMDEIRSVADEIKIFNENEIDSIQKYLNTFK
jgi:RNA polymerase primary sigma factor